jgi:cysteinyl-tRNA synthetase
VLGFLEFEVKKELPPDILAKIKEREKARREKNYALADKIREELFKKGIILEDTKEGTRWKIIK